MIVNNAVSALGYMHILLKFGQMLLGGYLLFVGYSKMIRIETVIASINFFQLAPPLKLALISALIGAEIAFGFAICFSWQLRAALSWATVMLAVFTAYSGWLLYYDPTGSLVKSCECSGISHLDSRINGGVYMVLKNCLLLGVSIIFYRRFKLLN
jgi:hypothetical protein